MPTSLSGVNGSITWGGTNVVWAGEWEHELDNQTQELDPHIGDAVIQEVDTGQKYTFKISGDVISTGDAGQNAMFAAAAARTTAALVLTQDLGKAVTYSAAKFTKLSIKTAATGTQSFEVEGNNGTGTVVLSQDT